MDWFEYLQKIGPFTAPLCIAMTLAMAWLLKDRGRILADLKLAVADQISFREKRLDEMAQTSREGIESANGIKMALMEVKAELRVLGAGGAG